MRKLCVGFNSYRTETAIMIINTFQCVVMAKYWFDYIEIEFNKNWFL